MAAITEEETRKTRLHHPKKVGNLDGPIIQIIFKKPVPGKHPGDPPIVPRIEGREPGQVYQVSEDLAHHYVQVLKCAAIQAVKEPKKGKPDGPGTKTGKRLRKEAEEERRNPTPGRARDRAMRSPLERGREE